MARESARVVVTGMGAVSCLGMDVQSMWAALIDGRCGIGPLTKADAEKHRIKHAGEVRGMPEPIDGMALDPAVRFAFFLYTRLISWITRFSTFWSSEIICLIESLVCVANCRPISSEMISL